MDARIIEKRQETPDTVTLRITADMTLTPGQFVMLGAPLLPPLVPGGAQRELKRSYSVAGHGAPIRHEGHEECADVHEGHLGHDGWIEVTIKEQPHGTLSRHAQELIPGDSVALYGPFGRHFLWDPSTNATTARADPHTHAVWIAGGTGIAPFRFMIKRAIENEYPGRITLLFSVKTKEDIIYGDEIESWKALLPGLKVLVALTRPAPSDLEGWEGLAGRIGEKAIKDALGGDVHGARFYVCGPTAMVQDVTAVLARLAVPTANIVTEKYGAIEG